MPLRSLKASNNLRIHLPATYQKIELALQGLFWVFIFTAVNVSWADDWFDPNLRPNTPPPLSVVLFPILFYAHAYWAIPKFLKARQWWRYALSLLLIFLAPELLRLLFYSYFLGRPLLAEASGRDSLLLGSPGIAWMAFVASALYRFLTDPLKAQEGTGKPPAPATPQRPALPPVEANRLGTSLERLMQEEQLFLRKDLDLSLVAQRLQITDKKLSALLNQHLQSNFPDFVNGYRLDCFVERVQAGQLEQLSVAGLAGQCGFSSKSTFYRAFKKRKGCTPSEYLKA